MGELPIVKLDRQKRGRPTILGAFIDDLVCQYVLALRSSGGVVNGKIVRAVAHALVHLPISHRCAGFSTLLL